jgi:hypothetical protein
MNNLPPLPERTLVHKFGDSIDYTPMYTDDQMREYALAAVRNCQMTDKPYLFFEVMIDNGKICLDSQELCMITFVHDIEVHHLDNIDLLIKQSIGEL